MRPDGMQLQTLRYRPVNLSAWFIGIGLTLFLLGAPLVLHSSLALTVLSQIGTFIIVALSFNMLLGQTGMLSFGHAVYTGLGAFVAIHAMNLVTSGAFWLPTSLIPLVGGLGGAFFGVLFGYVTTKKSGTTFAMITLGIGELVASSALMLPEFFGGEAGITTNRVIGQPVLGITYGPQIQVYYLIVVWLAISATAMYLFTQTPLGRIANAVRDNPERAEFVGYNTQRVRFLIVIIAGFFAGIGGGLSAINFEIVSSENVGTVRSGLYLLFTFLGGIGYFIGPIIGAVIYVLSFVLLSEVTKAWLLYIGVFFLVMLLYAPGGIASLIMINLRVFKYTKFAGFSRLLRPYAILAVAALLLLTGFVSLVEMTYLIRLDSANGTVLKLMWITLDTASMVPWIGSIVVLIAGYFVFRLAARIFMQTWSALQGEIEDMIKREAI